MGTPQNNIQGNRDRDETALPASHLAHDHPSNLTVEKRNEVVISQSELHRLGAIIIGNIYDNVKS